MGIVSIWSILILLINSDSHRFPVSIPAWLKNVKHLDIKHIYSVSHFEKYLTATEYHEQKSAGYIKDLIKSYFCAKLSCMEKKHF